MQVQPVSCRQRRWALGVGVLLTALLPAAAADDGAAASRVSPDVLTPEECRELIAFSEAIGYEAAPITIARGFELRPDIRDNARVMVDDGGRAETLWQRSRDELPGILKGRQVRIDTFVVPATSEIAAGLKRERINGQTLEEVFLAAGAKIGQPSCAACLGGPADTFGRLNTPISCISTTNRNFPGRMGHKEARVFLASPLTVAASAVTGVITDPREYLE